MYRETIAGSLLAFLRFGVCLCVCAVFSLASAPTLLADPIHNLDLHPHSDIFSFTQFDSLHPKHDSLIFKSSSLSGESSFFANPSLFTSFGNEDHWVWDSLAGKPNDGLHLGWETGVEHNQHHHRDGDPTNGNLPTDPVTEPEPSTALSLLSGLAIVLFFSSRKGVST